MIPRSRSVALLLGAAIAPPIPPAYHDTLITSIAAQLEALKRAYRGRIGELSRKCEETVGVIQQEAEIIAEDLRQTRRALAQARRAIEKKSAFTAVIDRARAPDDVALSRCTDVAYELIAHLIAYLPLILFCPDLFFIFHRSGRSATARSGSSARRARSCAR